MTFASFAYGHADATTTSKLRVEHVHTQVLETLLHRIPHFNKMATAMRTASIGFASRLTTTRSSVAARTHLTLRQRRPTASIRTFSATTRRFAQYERFGYDHSSARPDGFGSGGGGGGKRPSGSQHPIILALRRRLGDRGLVLWGVGLTGCGIYYVFQ